jgi:hypothetical protein
MFEIGTSLREARLRKGLTLTAASEATKIRGRHLQALEDEQFDVLPAQTYVRGFLKTYADYLGLDGQLYVDEYSSRFWVAEEGGPSVPRRVRVRRKHHGRIELTMIVVTLVVIAAVSSLVIAAWKFGGSSANTTAPVTPRAPKAVVSSRSSKTNLVVRAARGSSVIDVHRLNRAGLPGRLLFHGTLERGESQTFVAPKLWLSVRSPKHVTLALNGGSPLALIGTCPRTVVATPQQITSTVSCR